MTVGVAIAALASCGGRKNFSNENDRLRRELMESREALAEAEARAAELEAKLAESQYVESTGISPDALDALPRAAGVSIGRLSGPIDTDGDARPDAVELYVRPYDGRRRFIQIAGRLLAEARLLERLGEEESSDEGQRGRRLGSVALSPVELREAYRAGFASGPHYTIRIPLPGLSDPLAGEVLLRVELIDAVSGRRYTAERIVKARRFSS